MHSIVLHIIKIAEFMNVYACFSFIFTEQIQLFIAFSVINSENGSLILGVKLKEAKENVAFELMEKTFSKNSFSLDKSKIFY